MLLGQHFIGSCGMMGNDGLGICWAYAGRPKKQPPAHFHRSEISGNRWTSDVISIHQSLKSVTFCISLSLSQLVLVDLTCFLSYTWPRNPQNFHPHTHVIILSNYASATHGRVEFFPKIWLAQVKTHIYKKMSRFCNVLGF